MLFFLPTFIPLSLPSFFHMPESRLGLCVSLLGGLMGGVMGLSFVGLLVLPLSSVIPSPPLADPDPDNVASDPGATASAIVELDSGAAGEEVEGVNRTLNLDLCGDAADALSGTGADFRICDGGE